jgi:hypothetical protein
MEPLRIDKDYTGADDVSAVVVSDVATRGQVNDISTDVVVSVIAAEPLVNAVAATV